MGIAQLQPNTCKASEDMELRWPFCTECMCQAGDLESMTWSKDSPNSNALNSSSREGVWKLV